MAVNQIKCREHQIEYVEAEIKELMMDIENPKYDSIYRAAKLAELINLNARLVILKNELLSFIRD